MTTPNTTNIPAPRVPFVDERTGLISREWFRFLNNQFQLTGGGTTAISLADLELAPYSDAATEAELTVTQSRVEALEVAPPEKEHPTITYGMFYDTTTQIAAAPNTAYAITFNSSDGAYGVYLDPSNTSHIKVSRPATYNVQFSVQLNKTSGGTGIFDIWFRKNGTNIANSASRVRIQGNNAEVFSAANIFVTLSNGDYLQVMYAVSNVSVELTAFAAAAPVPAIPSIILTVTQVNL